MHSCRSHRCTALRHGLRHRRPPICCSVHSGGAIVREALTGPQRTKLDPSPDRGWYEQPRFVHHVDDRFRRQVTELYRQRVPQGASVLDLCSSWVSHLPTDRTYSRVVGHGLNAQELARNSRLDSFFVRDLNRDPGAWALEDGSFDAVLCCVSVQYWQHPERIMAEVYRVLKPGGVVIITFSNRMFYNKAIAAWRECGTGYGRCQLVKAYFASVAGFTEPEVMLQVPRHSSDVEQSESNGGSNEITGVLRRIWGRASAFLERSAGDPFYAVVAYRNYKEEA